MFDIRIVEARYRPRSVEVYVVATRETVAIFPVSRGDIAEAEGFAGLFLDALTNKEAGD